MEKVFFIGHFSNADAIKDDSASAAGDLVQSQIVNAIRCVNPDVVSISMEPIASWPKASIFKSKAQVKGIHFPGFINLPLVKNIFFSISLLKKIFFKSKKTDVVSIFIYNSYLFENIAVLLLKKIFKVKVYIFIQDVRIGGGFRTLVQKHDILSIKVAKSFDKIIVINKSIAEDFFSNLNPNQIKIFEGGVDLDMLENFRYNFDVKLKDYAVFAGALEMYNGIDKLVDAWIQYNIPITLHIFGKGSLVSKIKKICDANSNLKFHGYKTQSEVMSYQVKAKYNFCLRYDFGIVSKYFFPSKFFNISMYKGKVICNLFNGLSNELIKYINIVEPDLSNLKIILFEECDNENTWNRRINYLREHHCWRKLVTEVINQ